MAIIGNSAAVAGNTTQGHGRPPHRHPYRLHAPNASRPLCLRSPHAPNTTPRRSLNPIPAPCRNTTIAAHRTPGQMTPARVIVIAITTPGWNERHARLQNGTQEPPPPSKTVTTETTGLAPTARMTAKTTAATTTIAEPVTQTHVSFRELSGENQRDVSGRKTCRIASASTCGSSAPGTTTFRSTMKVGTAVTPHPWDSRSI